MRRTATHQQEDPSEEESKSQIYPHIPDLSEVSMKTMDFFFRKKVIPLLELPKPAGPLKGQSYLKEQGLEPTDLTKIQHKMFEVLYDATLEPLNGEAHSPKPLSY